MKHAARVRKPISRGIVATEYTGACKEDSDECPFWVNSALPIANVKPVDEYSEPTRKRSTGWRRFIKTSDEPMIGWEPAVSPPEPPKLIYPLAFEGLILGFLVIVGGLWLGAIGNAYGIFSIFGASVLVLLKIRNISTRVTEAGVSQLTLRGRVHLSWSEVTQVTRSPLSFTLAGTKRRLVVSVEEFADSAATISYMESHLPSKLRSN